MPSVFAFYNELLLLLYLDVSVLSSTSNTESYAELCSNDVSVMKNTQESSCQLERATDKVFIPILYIDVAVARVENLTCSGNRPSTSTRSQLFESNKNTVEFVSSYSPNQPTKLRIRRALFQQYRISPIHSDESDVDDSDADPNFPNLLGPSRPKQTTPFYC